MLFLFLLVAVGVVGVGAAVFAGRFDATMAPPTSTMPMPKAVPECLSAAQVQDLEFNTALRGYNMREVDHALACLEHALHERDTTIAKLTGTLDDDHSFAEQADDAHPDMVPAIDALPNDALSDDEPPEATGRD